MSSSTTRESGTYVSGLDRASVPLAHESDPEFEIARPRGSGRFYNFLIDQKFRSMKEGLPIVLSGSSVLDVCCGSGMISEYYAREGANVTGVDLDPAAIERARVRAQRYSFLGDFRVENACSLPFADESFDVVSVHDGLHHIPDPHKAVNEMARLARRAIVINEPALSFGTTVSMKVGISVQYEGDDFVYRFRRRELSEWLRSAGCKGVSTRRYLMYYPHKPGMFFRAMSAPAVFQLCKVAYWCTNLCIGGWGNKILAVGWK